MYEVVRTVIVVRHRKLYKVEVLKDHAPARFKVHFSLQERLTIEPVDSESKEQFKKVWAIVSICASSPLRTPIRAMSKPCIAWSKMSSSIWKPSPAAANSSPKHRPINSISISRDRTPTRNFKLPGKSSSGSLLARHSNSACFHPCFWIITSMTLGDTMYLAIPTQQLCPTN